jgi:hypothetical protein
MRDPNNNGRSNFDTYELLESIFYYDSSLASQGATFLESSGQLGNEGEIDLPGVDDDLTPQALELNFEPEEGGSATLSAPGNVRVGARLEGVGGSITAEGDIRVVGVGVDFAANPEAASGVNLYSAKNIVLSTFYKNKTTDDQLFYDVSLKGVIYAWGDFTAKMGHEEVDRWGKLQIEGALIAYGNDPETESPGQGSGGQIDVTANSLDLLFDPAYVAGLANSLPANPKLTQTLWVQY